MLQADDESLDSRRHAIDFRSQYFNEKECKWIQHSLPGRLEIHWTTVSSGGRDSESTTLTHRVSKLFNRTATIITTLYPFTFFLIKVYSCFLPRNFCLKFLFFTYTSTYTTHPTWHGTPVARGKSWKNSNERKEVTAPMTGHRKVNILNGKNKESR